MGVQLLPLDDAFSTLRCCSSSIIRALSTPPITAPDPPEWVTGSDAAAQSDAPCHLDWRLAPCSPRRRTLVRTGVLGPRRGDAAFTQRFCFLAFGVVRLCPADSGGVLGDELGGVASDVVAEKAGRPGGLSTYCGECWQRALSPAGRFVGG